MPTTGSDTALIVFAKAPVPGQVKTRLSPAMDGEAAAMLHAALVERALDTAARSGLPFELCCAPDDNHPFFENCAEDLGATLTEQGEGDLGERMLRALSRHPRAIVIGADCPALDGRHIAAAARALDTHDAVLTPAEDGGYVLIGTSRTDPRMFDGIDWGSEQVLAQQRRNFASLGFRVHEMPMLWDVDRPADLPRLKSLVPPLAFFWPA